MTDAIRHRGPDASGHWFSEDGAVSLGHRRLSILDLSEAGTQPMHSVCGRFVIVFNGEIYNFNELKNEIQAADATMVFRGHSDTEVLLAGFTLWGISATIKKAIGMFAIAVWDSQEKSLYLIRDRAGEKPLYWGMLQRTLIFASEIKACLRYPGFRPSLDRNSLKLYVQYSYIPAPFSVYEGLFKVKPGCLLVFKDNQIREECYWDLAERYSQAQQNLWQGSFGEVASLLEEKISKAIQRQMVADVPLGAFLSGGIDSSLVVSLMQAQSAKPIKTFTIGFNEKGYDEAVYAKQVAKHLGTEHTEVYISPQEALNVIPHLSSIYDEPFSDSSQIPTTLVSQVARKHVTVSLSGDAGDELFGGYQRYIGAQKSWEALSQIPEPLRVWMAKGTSLLNPQALNKIFGGRVGDRVQKISGILVAPDARALYEKLATHWDSSVILGNFGGEQKQWSGSSGFDFIDGALLDQMMLSDLLAYLPGDILTKVDRAAMSASLETRVPFLDHEVMEFAFRIPASMKVRDGKGKWPLRQILSKYVPDALIDRPKMGFGVPMDSWLRGELKEWAGDLLAAETLRRDEIFDAGKVQEKWLEHVSGKRNWQYHLWDVLMFQQWKSKLDDIQG